MDHKVDIYTEDGTEMNKVRMKAAHFILSEFQKDGAIPKGEKLNPQVVD